jgi:urease beta subunit
MRPGEIVTPDGGHTLAPGRERRAVAVVNTGDRPIQIGSHFHFADVNAALAFDRAAAHGFRLDIAAGVSRVTRVSGGRTPASPQATTGGRVSHPPACTGGRGPDSRARRNLDVGGRRPWGLRRQEGKRAHQ